MADCIYTTVHVIPVTYIIDFLQILYDVVDGGILSLHIEMLATLDVGHKHNNLVP